MKKNFNRILSLILCLVMCFSFSTILSAASVGLSVSLDSTEAEAGKLPSTVSMSVGTTSALSIMSFGAEAYASDSRITISEIQKEDTDLVSNTSTGRFAFMAMSETSVTNWATVVFSIPANLPAGTYTFGVRSVTASRSDNSNPIDGITEKSVTFTVTAAPEAISSFNLGVTAPAFGATPDSGAVMNQWSSSISWTPADATFQAGKTYTANVTLTAKDGYKFSADKYSNYLLSQGVNVNSCDDVNLSADGKTLSFSYTYDVVEKPSITITEDDITIAAAGKYTGSAKEPAVTVDGLSSGDYIVSYSNNTNAGNNASVTVSPAPNGQYTFTPVTKYFTIDKADQNISADDVIVMVGADDVDLGVGFDAKGTISISIVGTVPSGTSVNLQTKKMIVGNVAGTFDILISADATNNYNAATKQITVTITEKDDADVSIADATTSVTYGDAAFNLSASAANTGNNGKWTWSSNNTDILTVSNTGEVTVVGVGTATITAKYESDTTIGSAFVAITVNKANQSISGRHISVKAGKTVDLSEIFTAQGTLSYSIANGATISGNLLTAGNIPGTYDLEVTAAETENYKAVTRGYTVTVTAKEDDDPIIPIIPPVVTKHTLNFDTNGGSAIASVTKLAGSVVDLSGYVTTKSGYEFAGWYADKDLTEEVTSVTLSKNMTVYAKWTEIPAADEPCDGGENCSSYSFSDVDKNQWYHEGIDFVVENGMMNGVGDNKFDPNGVTSRAMIVTILYRLEGEPAVSGENPFSDVKDDTWYTDAVIWAESNGIVSGYGNGKFGPDDDITREQMAKIIYSYAEYKGYDVSARASLTSFSDAGKISSWATEEMQWAVAVGLINGMGDGTVAPQGDAERCQVAAIFMRFCENIIND